MDCITVFIFAMHPAVPRQNVPVADQEHNKTKKPPCPAVPRKTLWRGAILIFVFYRFL